MLLTFFFFHFQIFSRSCNSVFILKKLQKTLIIINFEVFLGLFIDFKISRYVYQYIDNKIL